MGRKKTEPEHQNEQPTTQEQPGKSSICREAYQAVKATGVNPTWKPAAAWIAQHYKHLETDDSLKNLYNNVAGRERKKEPGATTTTSKAAPATKSLDMSAILALNKTIKDAGGSQVVLQALDLAASLTSECGSLDAAKKAVDALEKLKEQL